jgi:NAD(P)-dependent dehydrogenase (short-subunit alcohol dehydrogenase family)
MSPLIAFIIGAGRNIGEHTAAALKAKGYQVALGSRKPDEDQIKKDGYFPVAIDAESPETLKAAFSQINRELGPPNVVIFNGICFFLYETGASLFHAFA